MATQAGLPVLAVQAARDSSRAVFGSGLSAVKLVPRPFVPLAQASPTQLSV
ncbi:hypothetical protein D3C78_1926440 [compost metagenome]